MSPLTDRALWMPGFAKHVKRNERAEFEQRYLDGHCIRDVKVVGNNTEITCSPERDSYFGELCALVDLFSCLLRL